MLKATYMFPCTNKMHILPLYPQSGKYYSQLLTEIDCVCKLLVETATVPATVIEDLIAQANQITITALETNDRFASVQLKSLNWRIRDQIGPDNIANGEHMFSEYPIFKHAGQVHRAVETLKNSR
jgi:hypothetical protein